LHILDTTVTLTIFLEPFFLSHLTKAVFERKHAVAKRTMDSENQMNFGGCKGVMLCNRPFGGLDGGGDGRLKRTMPLNEASSFICGTVKRPWGSNVAISEKERVLDRLSQKNEVLNRHRKWLHDLQKRKEERAKNCLREEEERESRKRRFMQNEAKKRAIVRGELFTDVSKNDSEPVSSSDDDENLIFDYEENESNEKSICSLTDEKEEAFDSQKFDYRDTLSRENLKKPKWAMTERIAADVQKDKENIEERGLLEFVHGLDFDKFSEDMELRILMEQVKKRIQSLEREKDKETERLQVVEDVSNWSFFSPNDASHFLKDLRSVRLKW